MVVAIGALCALFRMRSFFFRWLHCEKTHALLSPPMYRKNTSFIILTRAQGMKGKSIGLYGDKGGG